MGETREDIICTVAVEVAKPQHGHWQLAVRNIRVGVWSSGLTWNLHRPFLMLPRIDASTSLLPRTRHWSFANLEIAPP